MAFALMLQEAGAAAVAVHGRRREQRHHEGPADWEQIGAVRRALDIAVIANGNVRTRADAERALAATGCAAVMSATALLANPRLFAAPFSLRGGDGDGDGGGGDGGGGDGGGDGGGGDAGSSDVQHGGSA